ncbi:hypothetical protein OG21DRAFT_915359 [Imleria badia]|nr:hypothetical protein OG21DRAFT_915359 [Imleria badia]
MRARSLVNSWSPGPFKSAHRCRHWLFQCAMGPLLPGGSPPSPAVSTRWLLRPRHVLVAQASCLVDSTPLDPAQVHDVRGLFVDLPTRFRGFLGHDRSAMCRSALATDVLAARGGGESCCASTLRAQRAGLHLSRLDPLGGSPCRIVVLNTSYCLAFRSIHRS